MLIQKLRYHHMSRRDKNIFNISTSTTLFSYQDFIFIRVKQTSKYRENSFWSTIFYPNLSFCSNSIVIHKQVLIIDHIAVILETTYCFPRVRTLDWMNDRPLYQRVWFTKRRRKEMNSELAQNFATEENRIPTCSEGKLEPNIICWHGKNKKNFHYQSRNEFQM